MFPESFFDQLPEVLADAPARPGEEALHAEAQALLDAIGRDPALKAAAVDAAKQTDAEVIDPLLQFRNWGIPAGNNWSTIANGAVFSDDYLTRTAVARSNILVNSASETAYLYQDLDADGARLNGGNRYEVTFAPGATPPVDGFWSLTLYDEHHFFVPNPIDRYSLGTKNKTMQVDEDGSLTIHVQAQSPGPERESNWLPAPAGADFTLCLRAYGPKPEIADGCWTPPAVKRVRQEEADMETPALTQAISDQDVSDAYIYLLARLLITRQQQVDFDQEGFEWNTLVHRKPGQVDWPNPNLDVAYSEAWVVLDDASCLLVTVPKIGGRYYTVEFLNGWGETLANINEREYPEHPDGLFAIVLEGSDAATPEGAQRIELPERVTRVLARVELGANWNDAVALQHQFEFEIRGNPAPPEIPRTVMFDMEALPGVEAFESAILALDSYPDTNQGMDRVQAKARAIAEAVKDRAERVRIDGVIRTKALRDFAAASPNIGHGTVRNNWARPACCGHFGDDWLTRSLVNFAGIWANTFDEVIYYKGNLDGTGAQINADNTYSLTFPADDLPEKYAQYFWSIIAVDTGHMRVLPNPANKFLLNKESGLQYDDDGSLTLWFGPDKPAEAPESNWLPTPGGKDYRFTFRFYGPLGGVADGSYYPPPVQKVAHSA